MPVPTLGSRTYTVAAGTTVPQKASIRLYEKGGGLPLGPLPPPKDKENLNDGTRSQLCDPKSTAVPDKSYPAKEEAITA